MSQTGKFHVHTHRKNPRSSATVPDKQILCSHIVKIADVGDRRGQYLQSRNASDSSDHVVKIADRLGLGVHTGGKNPRRRRIVKIPYSYELGQMGTRLQNKIYFVQKKSKNSIKAKFFLSFGDFSGCFECVLVQLLLTLLSVPFYIRSKAIIISSTGDMIILCVG